MASATESRPSWPDDRITLPGGSGEPSPARMASAASGTHERVREAIPSPPPLADVPQRRSGDGANAGKSPSSMSPRHTSEIVESLQTFVEQMETMNDGGDGSSLMDSVRKFACNMQRKVAKLGGVASAEKSAVSGERRSHPSIVDGTDPDRPSFSNSLDGYRPDIDVVAPISVRPVAMELLWVCGDCGEHYPRARQCPEKCKNCGAPKQNFYAPIED